MDHFNYKDNDLFAESVPIAKIIEHVGTPTYVYSKATLSHHYEVFKQAFARLNHQVCFAVKANSNIAVLQTFTKLGAGFDIVASGELQRVLAANGEPNKVIFSGIGKTEAEIRFALDANVGCFNIESEPELIRLSAIAKSLQKTAKIAFRINPDICAETHPYITTGLKHNKFGVNYDSALTLYQLAKTLPNIHIQGIAFHIGSQLTQIAPYRESLKKILTLIDTLAEHGITIKTLDIGGGLGVRYQNELPPLPNELGEMVTEMIGSRPLKILLEPGRAIAANAGILVTKVEYIKISDQQAFAIVDAGMNDLLRPSLYEAWHDIWPVHKAVKHQYHDIDVVGPVCESGDFIARQRDLSVAQNDLLAVRSAGAYGFTMSSNYNSRPRACEVMVDGDNFYVIRRREIIEDLLKLESLLP